MIYAIGDIHGQVTMLCAMLEHLQNLPLRAEDTIVFVGDYVDRGESSSAVIERLLRLRDQFPNCVFLRGNHEQLMLDARAGGPPQPGTDPGTVALENETLLWFQNGGIETLLSYQERFETEQLLHWWDFIPEAHWEFLNATRCEFITERFHFVHAGVLPPGRSWEHQELGLDPRLWIREPFLSSEDDFEGRIVVFGHTPQTDGQPFIKPNMIGIDTGAVFGGPLTAIACDPALPPRKAPAPVIYQVEFTRSDLPVG